MHIKRDSNLNQTIVGKYENSYRAGLFLALSQNWDLGKFVVSEVSKRTIWPLYS